MAKKKKRKKAPAKKKGPTSTDLVRDIRASFGDWKKLKAKGGSDPFWPDGTNMNLVRNHILHDQRKLREICNQNGEKGCPRESCLKPPPEVRRNYMAPGSKSAVNNHEIQEMLRRKKARKKKS